MGTLNNCTNCGCNDNFITTPAPCPTAVACPTQECANTMFAQCIAYVGDPILCGEATVVPTDTNLDSALSDIVNYFCAAIENVPTVTVVGGTNVTVTSAVVGNNTEYTVNSTGGGGGGSLAKISQSFNVATDPFILTMSNTDLVFCGIPSLACNNEAVSLSDFVYNVMFKTAPGTGTEWVTVPVGDITVVADEITGDIIFTSGVGAVPTGSIVRITLIG